MISVNADFLLQSFVIPIFLILPEFILSSFLTQSLLLEFSSCLSSDGFSLLICLDATKFLLLSAFTLLEKICPKNCSKLRFKKAKNIFG